MFYPLMILKVLLWNFCSYIDWLSIDYRPEILLSSSPESQSNSTSPDTENIPQNNSSHLSNPNQR